MTSFFLASFLLNKGVASSREQRSCPLLDEKPDCRWWFSFLGCFENQSAEPTISPSFSYIQQRRSHPSLNAQAVDLHRCVTSFTVRLG